MERYSPREKGVENDAYAQPEFIEITVSEPQLVRDETGRYTRYCVRTETNYPEYKSGHYTVYRRYNQFASLRILLKEQREANTEIAAYGKIPKLPGDTFKSIYFPGYRFKDEFVEQRAKDLQAFLNALVRHPSLVFNDVTIKFLTEAEFPIVKEKTKVIMGSE